MYTVKAGDSLSSIAAKYGTTYKNIMKLNGLNNFLIVPGQKLKVSGSVSTSKSTSGSKKRLQVAQVVHLRTLFNMVTLYH